ncbi:hypothetical protein ACH4SP_12955 [Streptomyces sp. NPDC021093]|uniref:hypothetical protein n=1 Tax=Streptomyces sp. NPDC021093 TaxID=3365112 RepID=UPI0037ADDA94
MRRQGVAVGSCAVALCLGGLLAVGGDGGSDKGFVAVGAAGAGPEGAPTKAVPPEGRVELVPLDPTASDSPSARSAPDPSTPGSGGQSADTAQRPGNAPAGRHSGSSSGTPGPGRTTRPPESTPPRSGPSQPEPPQPGTSRPEPRPPSPAALTVGSPVRADADRRWCEKVTVALRNSGGTAVRSGTVTFATHIIGALGIDWGTRMSSQPLPGPIGPGAARSVAYTVCVDAWRVPLGMHVETRRTTATWK